jgi:hypothetical protein
MGGSRVLLAAGILCLWIYGFAIAQPNWRLASGRSHGPDLNGDTFVDFADFAALAENWGHSGSGLSGDLDDNGIVYIEDLEQLVVWWLEEYECKSADFNFDHIVNFLDFAELANSWLSNSGDAGWDSTYDLDESDTIDIYDLRILAERWLKYETRIIYVDASANLGGDSSSWETAFIYLQDALDIAQPGDQIWVAEGTYYPDEDNIEPRHTNDDRAESFQLREYVKLYGGFAGSETSLAQRNWTEHQTILSGDIDKDDNGEPDYDNSYHVVKVNNADNAVLDGFTIMRACYGTANYYGGGVYMDGNAYSLRVVNCTFRENCTYGAIAIDGGILTLINCNFIENQGGWGNAIYNNGVILSMIDCSFSNNFCASSLGYCQIYGGAIYNNGTIQSIVNCKFSGNHVSVGGGPYPPCGGGIYNNGHIQILDKCTFSNNGAYGGGADRDYEGRDYGGGGIYNGGSIEQLSNCIFSENKCFIPRPLSTNWVGGGGICNNGKLKTITNCGFYKNRSSWYGGGVYVGHNNPTMIATTVTNCTFFENEAKYGSGGAILKVWDGHTLTITNSISWHNKAFVDIEEPGVLMDYDNGFAGNFNCYNSCINNYVWEPIIDVNNISVAPQFIDPNDPNGPDNVLGTSDDGLALSPASPCIDTGDGRFVPLGVITDIKGDARFNGAAVDMGAFEFGNLDINIDSDGDGMADWFEFKYNLDPEYDGDAGMDNDSDDLTNLGEYQAGTDPTNPDTDGDSLSDGDEISLGTDPINPDTDGDGLSDGDEILIGTDPHNPDTDGDGMSDSYEVLTGTDPTYLDTDNDLLPDKWEVENGLDPLVSDNINSDTDGDGLTLLKELIYRTNPVLPDTDGDGTNDGTEAAQGSYPNYASDNGAAPSADEICVLQLTVGDPSSTRSERYDLVIYEEGESSPFVIHHQGPEFGVVTTDTYNQFRPGKRYEVKLKHLATNGELPDYDFRALVEPVSIPAGVICEIEDPEQILQFGYYNQDHPEFPMSYFFAAGKTAYVNLIKVNLADIKFNHTSGDTGDGIDIYDVAEPEWVKDGQNEPAAYKKNTDVMIKAKFTVSPPSSSITSAKIRATTTDGILGNLSEQTVNFSGGVSSPEYITFTPSNATPISIGEETVTWQWKAKDLNGQSSPEHNIGLSGPHTIYTVYDSPKCAASEYTKDHLFQATEFGDGGINASQICSNVQFYLHVNQNFKKNTGPNGESGVWNIIFPGGPGNQGDCIAHANLMKVSLKVLGIDASYAFIADAANQPSEDDPVYKEYHCVKHNREERRWFRHNSGEYPWNFEGVCGTGGIYYDVTMSTTSGTYDYCKTAGNGIVYQWVYMYESSPGNWLICEDQNDTHIPR